MADFKEVSDLLKSGDSPIKVVTAAGGIVRLELKSGDAIEFAREHIGGVDWQTVRLNDELVYQH